MSNTVLDLQRRLTALGFNPGPIDGIKGQKTIDAVKAAQQKYGLVVDGIAGPQTMTALKRAEADPKPGRTEPDKSAMLQPVPAFGLGADIAMPPPNVASLRLLDTARFINEIIAHCTATPEGKDFTVDDIRAWHKLRGFSDIGYHYIIYRDGRIMLGRPIGQIGAHVEGHNTGTIGISYVGGVSADGKTAKDTRTAAQRSSMLRLTAQLCRKFPIAKVTGHNQYANKACPSFDVRKDALSRLAA
ncbi:peptidoglycan-binding protein [Neorhizobium sp. NCHU2750]|uniref:peptidoglycan recognition protein family protein n=1 Tax=Neorhizobium sp. NCHU2750 TaxID=1825976 RepID=UPI000E715D39|nr:N-acetylmuramoyl-L-alanine amidase [Neorhizobium sp. NCHU2750]